jgi:hypothetical protein
MKENYLYENESDLYLSDYAEPYQIDIHHSNLFRNILDSLNIDVSSNEYGECVISGKRIA